MNQETVTTYFSKNPEKYAKEYERETAEGYAFRRRKERLLELLGKGAGKLLDIGCGPAVMTREIISLGWNYHGSDISDTMIEEAKKRFPEVLFSVDDATKINVPSHSYQRIVAMGLVEYIDDEAALTEFTRILAPHGHLFVSIPNIGSPARLWDRFILSPRSKINRKSTRKPSQAFFHRKYALSKYKKLLEKYGFSVKKVVAYNFRVIPRPFDMWFPRLSVNISKILEPLRSTPLSFLATAFVVEAIKKD